MHLFSAYLVGRMFSGIPGALPSLGTEPPPSSHPAESALTGHGGSPISVSCGRARRRGFERLQRSHVARALRVASRHQSR